MLLPLRLCGLALFAVTTLLSPPHVAATHAPVWSPAMDAAPVDSGATVKSDGLTSFSLPLYNIRDFDYYAKFHVGSPPQFVRLAFSVAASDLAVLAIKSEGHYSYNESKSSTFQADGRAVTLDDETSGVLVRDRFVLHEDVAVDAQYFTAIDNVSTYNPYYRDLRFDGWFGLAPRSTQSVGQVPTILHSLFGSSVVAKPIVGLSMPQGENGFVSFGQVSNYAEDELTYVAQEHPGLWTYPIDKVDLGGKPIASRVDKGRADNATSFAVLDNTAFLVTGPPVVAEAIANAVGAKKLTRLMWAIACDASLPDITFWNGDTALSFTAKELVGDPVSETDCIFNIRAWGSRQSPISDWSFGPPVFQRYVFGFLYEEPPRLAFALHRPKKD